MNNEQNTRASHREGREASELSGLVMPPSLRLVLIGTAFIFSGIAVEALGLITEPAYWAFYGALWGMIAAKTA